MPTDIALCVNNLHFQYGATPVLHGVSLDVPAGAVCGLLGPNGSGKTTLFKCCMKFLAPTQGSIAVDGQDIARMSTAAFARHVAYVPQEHRQAFPFLVRDVVLMGRTPHMRRLFRLDGKDRQEAHAALEQVGMAHLADTPCNRLSGGQRQLVLIARALAQETPVLLLDEPTSALDFSNQMAVWGLLRAIARRGKTVVVCCHDPNHILWFCDRVAVLHQGRVLTEGAPQTVVTTEVLHTIYGPCCEHSGPCCEPSDPHGTPGSSPQLPMVRPLIPHLELSA